MFVKQNYDTVAKEIYALILSRGKRGATGNEIREISRKHGSNTNIEIILIALEMRGLLIYEDVRPERVGWKRKTTFYVAMEAV